MTALSRAHIYATLGLLALLVPFIPIATPTYTGNMGTAIGVFVVRTAVTILGLLTGLIFTLVSWHRPGITVPLVYLNLALFTIQTAYRVYTVFIRR